MWLDEVTRHVGLRPQFLGLNKALYHYSFLYFLLLIYLKTYNKIQNNKNNGQ